MIGAGLYSMCKCTKIRFNLSDSNTAERSELSWAMGGTKISSQDHFPVFPPYNPAVFFLLLKEGYCRFHLKILLLCINN